jgi:hypothetical protein
MKTTTKPVYLQSLVSGEKFKVECVNVFAPVSPIHKNKNLVPEIHNAGGKQEQFWRDPVDDVLYAIVNPI